MKFLLLVLIFGLSAQATQDCDDTQSKSKRALAVMASTARSSISGIFSGRAFSSRRQLEHLVEILPEEPARLLETVRALEGARNAPPELLRRTLETMFSLAVANGAGTLVEGPARQSFLDGLASVIFSHPQRSHIIETLFEFGYSIIEPTVNRPTLDLLERLLATQDPTVRQDLIAAFLTIPLETTNRLEESTLRVNIDHLARFFTEHPQFIPVLREGLAGRIKALELADIIYALTQRGKFQNPQELEAFRYNVTIALLHGEEHADINLNDLIQNIQIGISARDRARSRRRRMSSLHSLAIEQLQRLNEITEN